MQGPGAMQICGPEVLRSQQPGEQIPIAAPASEHPQTLQAAGASGAAILVVDAAATSFEELQAEVEQFEGIGVQLAGSILIERATDPMTSPSAATTALGDGLVEPIAARPPRPLPPSPRPGASHR